MKKKKAIEALDSISEMPCLAFDVVRDIYKNIEKARENILKHIDKKDTDTIARINSVFNENFGIKEKQSMSNSHASKIAEINEQSQDKTISPMETLG
jgi:predicted transcriptional regulator